jgi:hypothetical protein
MKVEDLTDEQLRGGVTKLLALHQSCKGSLDKAKKDPQTQASAGIQIMVIEATVRNAVECFGKELT